MGKNNKKRHASKMIDRLESSKLKDGRVNEKQPSAGLWAEVLVMQKAANQVCHSSSTDSSTRSDLSSRSLVGQGFLKTPDIIESEIASNEEIKKLEEEFGGLWF